MRRVWVGRVVLLAALAASVTAGVLDSKASARAEAAASACRCPLIYAPVVCDNGKVYPNQCVADCHHAKNCVPAGI